MQEIRDKITDGAKRKAVLPCIIATVMVHREEILQYELEDVCLVLGIPNSYLSTVRAVLQVEEELAKQDVRLKRN